MVAIVLSLVYRQMSGLSEVLRTLEQEGLLWVEAQSVSKQARSNRLRTLPATLFAQLFEQVLGRIQLSRPAPALSLAECPVAVWGNLVSRWLHLRGDG